MPALPGRVPRLRPSLLTLPSPRPTPRDSSAPPSSPDATLPTRSARPEPIVLILDGRPRIAVESGFDPQTLRRLLDVLEGPAVIGLPPTLRVFVASAPVDLRKSYEGSS
jgi:hypothetical protein